MNTRPYRPANGTEAAIFDDLWCSNCQADAGWRNGTEEHCCDILTRTMIYDVDEPGYPPEWIEDDVPLAVRVQDQHTGRWYPEIVDTHPRCTAFVPIGDESTYVADERQGKLGV